MQLPTFPVIDLVATGRNIRRLRIQSGLTVREMQRWFGFDAPQAIYRWESGRNLPTVDHLYALSRLFQTPMEGIIVHITRDAESAQRPFNIPYDRPFVIDAALQNAAQLTARPSCGTMVASATKISHKKVTSCIHSCGRSASPTAARCVSANTNWPIRALPGVRRPT